MFFLKNYKNTILHQNSEYKKNIFFIITKNSNQVEFFFDLVYA